MQYSLNDYLSTIIDNRLSISAYLLSMYSAARLQNCIDLVRAAGVAITSRRMCIGPMTQGISLLDMIFSEVKERTTMRSSLGIEKRPARANASSVVGLATHNPRRGKGVHPVLLWRPS